jgi:hypothetical protein
VDLANLMWQTPSKMELAAAGTDQGLITKASSSSFGNRTPNVQISLGAEGQRAGKLRMTGHLISEMDKIAGLREILALDAKNSFARYGVAMELASRGETPRRWRSSTRCSRTTGYTAGYFMAAQTLAKAGRRPEAAERLKAGIGSAARAATAMR